MLTPILDTKELVNTILSTPYLFENITKEQYRNRPQQYYSSIPATQGNCFKIAEHLIQLFPRNKIKTISVAINKDNTHSAALIDERYFVDASMPLIFHDILLDVSHTVVGTSVLEKSDTEDSKFSVTRTINGVVKGPFIFDFLEKPEDYAINKMAVWEESRISNKMLAVKTFMGGALHELKLDTYTIYDLNGEITHAEQEFSEQRCLELLEFLGIDITVNDIKEAFDRLYAKQCAIPERMKKMIRKVFI